MIAEAGQYSRTRLLRWRLAALWALLVATLLAAAPASAAGRLTGQAALLALAVGLLRLWDDLADLDHDRREHPQRVLVTGIRLGPFVAVLTMGLLFLALAFHRQSERLAVYCALLVGLGLLYHTQPGGRLPRSIRGCLVLSKYPVLIFLAGAGPSVRAWLAAICLYGLLLGHEWYDDRELRAASFLQVAVGGGLGLLVISLLFLTGDGQP